MTWAPDYITSAELKAFKNIGDAADDAEVALVVTAGSRAVDNATGRQFGQLASATEWIYTACWDRHRGRYIVSIDDLDTTTGLVVKVAGTATTDYTLEPRNAVAKGKVWTQLVFGTGVGSSTVDDIAITARWGWSAVPSTVKIANKLQSSRFLARRNSPFGVAGSPTDGSELRLLAKVDPDVAVMLAPYIRHWVAG